MLYTIFFSYLVITLNLIVLETEHVTKYKYQQYDTNFKKFQTNLTIFGLIIKLLKYFVFFKFVSNIIFNS